MTWRRRRTWRPRSTPRWRRSPRPRQPTPLSSGEAPANAEAVARKPPRFAPQAPHCPSTLRSGCLDLRHSAPKSSGRAFCRCSSAAPSTRFHLSRRRSCSASASGAPQVRGWRANRRGRACSSPDARSASPSPSPGAAALINRAFPYWPIDPALAPGPWFNFQIDLLRAFVAVVPAACFWGASFPLALAAAGPRAGDQARLVGAVYAANTIGAVVGAVIFSLRDHSGLRHAGRAASADLDRACRRRSCCSCGPLPPTRGRRQDAASRRRLAGARPRGLGLGQRRAGAARRHRGVRPPDRHVQGSELPVRR